MLSLREFESPDEFMLEVGEFLYANEAEYSLMAGFLGALEGKPRPESYMMLSGSDRGACQFAALYTGLLVIVTHCPAEAIDLVADALAAKGIETPGVIGPPESVRAFSRRWRATHSCSLASTINQRIYELRSVSQPAAVPGHWRFADELDYDLLAAWLEAFHLDAVPHQPYSIDGIQRLVRERVRLGRLFLWEANGIPVAVTGIFSANTDYHDLINAVYTPDEHRRNGYATALVAAASAHVLSLGKTSAVLYTDLANPTSNSIYMKIGYKPVADSENHWFSYSKGEVRR